MTTEQNSTYVLIETMPDHLRGSHRAARNWGVYPHNGSKRAVVTVEQAAALVDEEYDHVVRELPSVGERVEVGRRGSDAHDRGVVWSITVDRDGDVIATVGWDSGVSTPIELRRLRAERT